MLKVSIAIVVCVAGFSTTAFAQNQRGAMREACKADLEKLCVFVDKLPDSFPRRKATEFALPVESRFLTALS